MLATLFWEVNIRSCRQIFFVKPNLKHKRKEKCPNERRHSSTSLQSHSGL